MTTNDICSTESIDIICRQFRFKTPLDLYLLRITAEI